MPSHTFQRGRGSSPCVARRGFTLAEMLVVMGIIGVLLAVATPVVVSVNKSRSLNNAGRLFTNLLTIARTEAITRHTVVRLEVATTWPDPAYKYRKLALTAATLNASGTAYTFQQIGAWETIPDGVVFEVRDPLKNSPPTDGSVYVFDIDANTAPLGDTGSLTYAGSTVTTTYVAFTSSGAPTEANPPAGVPVPLRARLVEGILNGTTITYTRRNAGLTGGYTGANWLDVRINNLFGRIEIGRPESPLP